MYDSFGNLNINGYQGHKFPVVLGETGSKFITATDLQSMADISAWVSGKANTGPTHNAANVRPYTFADLPSRLHMVTTDCMWLVSGLQCCNALTALPPTAEAEVCCRGLPTGAGTLTAVSPAVFLAIMVVCMLLYRPMQDQHKRLSSDSAQPVC